MKLGGVLLAVGAVDEMSCGGTGCLSCLSKEAINIIIIIIIIVGAVAGVYVGDSIELLQLGTAVGRGAMAFGME